MASTAPITLQIPPGVVRGSTLAMTPGRWTDANLVRWREGNLQPIGGWLRASATALASTPRKLLPWEGAGLRHMGIMCENHVIVETEGAFFDATPVGFVGQDANPTQGGYGTAEYNWWDYGTARPDTYNPYALPANFSADTWGELLLFVSSSDGRLYEWDPAATPYVKAVVTTSAPTGIRTMVVTDERHVMIGNYDGNPRRVGWSSRENRNDWDFANVNNTAGFLDLNTPGTIIGMTRVREGVLVFTTVDVWIVRFVGYPFIYGIERLSMHASPVSPQAIAPFEGRAAWMAREGFFMYDGGVVRPIPSAVGDFVYKTLDRGFTPFRAHGSANGLFPEVWWWYPSDGQTEPDRYVCWNYVENWWSIGAITRTASASAGLFPNPYGTGADNHLYQHENGDAFHGALPYAETGMMSIAGGGRLLSALQAQPDSGEDVASLQKTQMTFYSRKTLDGVESVHGPYTARNDGYMDVRFTARDVRVRVQATQEGHWTVGATRLWVAQRGKR